MDIKSVRKQKRMTQDGFSALLGISRHWLWRIENGQVIPSHELKIKINNLLTKLDTPEVTTRIQTKALDAALTRAVKKAYKSGVTMDKIKDCITAHLNRIK